MFNKVVTLAPQVNFSHIVKFETFDRDQRHILNKSGVGNLVNAHKESILRISISAANFSDKLIFLIWDKIS
jgi:hypothetical protein